MQSNQSIPFVFITATLPDSSVYNTYSNVGGKFTLEIEQTLSTADSIEIQCKMIGHDISKTTTLIKDYIKMEVFLAQQHGCLKGVSVKVDRKTIIQGGYMGRTFTGIPTKRNENSAVFKGKLLDDYDTKIYHQNEIERFSLGR